VTCSLPRIPRFARNVRLAGLVRERNAAGKLVPVDLALAATPPGAAFLQFRKPSGVEVRMEATVDVPTSAGAVYVLSPDGFLDEVGEWEVQALVYLPGALVGQGFFPSEVGRFEVVFGLEPLTPAPVLSSSAAGLALVLPAVSVA